jgi:soluble lytic murein transglycosylase-like protein
MPDLMTQIQALNANPAQVLQPTNKPTFSSRIQSVQNDCDTIKSTQPPIPTNSAGGGVVMSGGQGFSVAPQKQPMFNAIQSPEFQQKVAKQVNTINAQNDAISTANNDRTSIFGIVKGLVGLNPVLPKIKGETPDYTKIRQQDQQNLLKGTATSLLSNAAAKVQSFVQEGANDAWKIATHPNEPIGKALDPNYDPNKQVADDMTPQQAEQKMTEQDTPISRQAIADSMAGITPEGKALAAKYKDPFDKQQQDVFQQWKDGKITQDQVNTKVDSIIAQQQKAIDAGGDEGKQYLAYQKNLGQQAILNQLPMGGMEEGISNDILKGGEEAITSFIAGKVPKASEEEWTKSLLSVYKTDGIEGAKKLLGAKDIAAAAVQVDGKTYTGISHADAIAKLPEDLQPGMMAAREEVGKFQMDNGDLISRDQAEQKFGIRNSEEVPHLKMSQDAAGPAKIETPIQIPKESPQGRFHGTSSELKKLMSDEEMYSHQNIYGQGFYTTDSHSIAEGYSKKGKGGSPSIYDIKENGKVPIYNIEKPMDKDILADVNKFDTADMYPYKQGDTLKQVYDDIRELSASGEFSTDTAQEYFDSIKNIVSEKGYRGIEHTGGKLTGKEPHNVKIYWNPSEDLTHTKLDSPSPIQTPNVLEEAPKTKPTKTIDKNRVIPDKLFNSKTGAEVYTELDTAKAGERIYLKNEGEVSGVAAQKSSFPDWIPEDLRSSKLVNEVKDAMMNDTLPTSKPGQRLYDVVNNKIREGEGLPLYDFAKYDEMIHDGSQIPSIDLNSAAEKAKVYVTEKRQQAIDTALESAKQNAGIVEDETPIKNKLDLSIQGNTDKTRVASAINRSETVRNTVNTLGKDTERAMLKLPKADLSLFDKYEEGMNEEDLAKLSKNPSQFKKALDKLKNFYDMSLSIDRSLGGLTKKIETYIPHYWDLSDPEMLAEFNRLAKAKGLKEWDGLPGHSMPRVFKTYAEGIDAGFTRKNADALGDLRQYYEGASNALSKRTLLQGLQDAVPDKVSAAGTGMTEKGQQFVDLTDKDLRGMSVHPQVAKQLKGFNELRSKDLFNELSKAGFSITDHKSWPKLVEGYTNTGFGNTLGTFWDRSTGPVKRWILQGPFHLLNVGTNFLGRGIFNPIKAVRGVAEAIPAFFSETATQAIEDSFKNTMVKGQNISKFDHFLQSGVDVDRSAPLTGLAQLNPAKQFRSAVFDRALYTLKMNMADMSLGSGKFAAGSPKAIEIGKEINMMMGEMNPRTMGLDPNTLKIFDRFLLAPKFTISKWKVTGDALTKWGGENTPAGMEALRGVIGKSIAMGTLATMGTKIMTGKYPNLQQIMLNYTIDPQTQTNQKNPAGHLQDWAWPKTFISEIAGGLVDPQEYAQARLNPGLSDVIDWKKNTDFYGNQISNPEDSLLKQNEDKAKNIGIGSLPIPVQNAIKYKQGMQTFSQMVTNIAGLRTHTDPNDPVMKYFNNFDGVLNGMNQNDKNTINTLYPIKKDAQGNVIWNKPGLMNAQSATTLWNDINSNQGHVIDAIGKIEKLTAQQTGSQYDPLYDLNHDQQARVLQVRAMQGLDPGQDAANRKQLLYSQSWYKDYEKKESDFYKTLPPVVQKDAKGNTLPPYPTVTPELNTKIDAYFNGNFNSKQKRFMLNASANADLRDYLTETRAINDQKANALGELTSDQKAAQSISSIYKNQRGGRMRDLEIEHYLENYPEADREAILSSAWQQAYNPQQTPQTSIPAPKPVSMNNIGTDVVNTVKNMISSISGTAHAEEYAQPIADAAQQNNVPPQILTALLNQESGFNPNAVSRAGATGIAQFMPGAAASNGVDPTDPNSSINGAAQYLNELYTQFQSWPLALAAYNAGAGAVEKYGGIPPYPETQNYVNSIMAASQQ